MTEIPPVVGNWYKQENGDRFEVVALDRADGTVEIQYYDGTIEELDFDSWQEMEIEETEAPDDWTGSVDVDEEEFEDLQDRPEENFDDPLEYLDRQE